MRSGVVNAQGKLVLFADADGATPLSEVERLEAALDARRRRGDRIARPARRRA